MNRIFKSKWCAATQSYVACSELAKRAGKLAKVGAVAICGFLGSNAWAQECTLVDASGQIKVASGVECDVSGAKDISVDAKNAVSVEGIVNSNNAVLNIATQSNENTYEPTGMSVSGDKAMVKGEALSINISPKETGKNVYNAGVRVINGGTVALDTLNIKTVDELEVDRVGGVDNATYGIQIGTGINWADASKDKTSKVIVNNANIEVTTTENSRKAGWYKKLPIFGESKIFDVFHQLSGVRLIRRANESSTPYFESKQKLNIYVHDNTAQKNVADYLVGIYISGKDAKAVLNDSEIKIEGSGRNSSALKIGKVREVGSGNGVIESKGHMVLNTENAKLAPTVRLLGEGSVLKADFENSSSEIKSASNAILYATQDFRFSGGFGGVSGNSDGKGQEVALKNAVITTTSNEDSLIKVESKSVYETGNSYYQDYNVYNGNFAVTEAKFTLTGEKSVATAAKDGWLIEVEGIKNKPSDLAVTVSDKAKVIGLVDKKFASKLEMMLDDGAAWTLSRKGKTHISKLNNLALLNGSVLDATTISSLSQSELNKQVEDAELALKKAQKLTKGWLEEDDDYRVRKAKAITDAELSLEKAKQAKNQGEKNNAEYVLKLTSDGTKTDGALINGGIITMDNGSHNDVLTLEGSYVAKPGATLKINTLWNTPGDENGINSESDLFDIKGSAKGKTQVFSRTANTHQHDLIDGTIGSIAKDLNTNSAPIIRIHDPDNSDHHAFVGIAKTTGAGQLQLKEVDKVEQTGGKVREYVWTLTVANTDQPILEETIPSYAQMPLVNLEQGYSTLSTLHSRRGENQVYGWDYCGSCGNDVTGQSWGRVSGSHLHIQGKTRLGYDAEMYSAQVGYDFAVQRTESKGHHVTGVYAAYTRANADFFDDLRAENALVLADKYVGKGKATGWGLGLSHTRYAANGSYLDLGGQVTFLSNKYTSRDLLEAKNKGVSYLVSAEVGRPFALGKHEKNQAGWLLEPQAQLSYQYLDMKGFNDGERQVEQGDVHGLRGRVGARLAYNQPAGYENLRTKTFYVTANLLHDFNNAKAVKIGEDKVRDKYEKTWWDIGLGIQHPVGQNAYVYLDVNYEGNFTGERRREGYRGAIGLKYNW
ncbi:autotransporter outer membrane beta-barrel domain-containing protein [Pasteurella sp. P03HT]